MPNKSKPRVLVVVNPNASRAEAALPGLSSWFTDNCHAVPQAVALCSARNEDGGRGVCEWSGESALTASALSRRYKGRLEEFSSNALYGRQKSKMSRQTSMSYPGQGRPADALGSQNKARESSGRSKPNTQENIHPKRKQTVGRRPKKGRSS
jgi:hypothetical protein